MEKKEYIERGKLIDDIKRVYCAGCDNWNEVKCRACAIDDAILQIDSAPAADVVEVVHGEWIWNEDCECWVCSVCERSALNNYRGLSVNGEYCPHCGAKMDGGNRNADA